MMRGILAALALIALTACAARDATDAPANPNAASVGTELEMLASDGREIAEAQCAACHAVGPYGDSPDATAPTFRTVLARYNADVLEEELINGVRVAHPMPDFQFNPQSVDALIAYLQSIQTPAP